MPNNAWSIFDALKTKYTTIKPDNFTYTTLINGLKSSKDGLNLVKAFSLFDEYK
jgi:pentatricopeptide repeat domain-containing protein 1